MAGLEDHDLDELATALLVQSAKGKRAARLSILESLVGKKQARLLVLGLCQVDSDGLCLNLYSVRYELISSFRPDT